MSEFDEQNYVYMQEQEQSADVDDESLDGSNTDSSEMRYWPAPSSP